MNAGGQWRKMPWVGLLFLLLCGPTFPGGGVLEFNVASGDVAALRNALEIASTNNPNIITRITLQAGTYDISQDLPTVSTVVEIIGQGDVVLNGMNRTGVRALFVGRTGDLQLENVEVRQFVQTPLVVFGNAGLEDCLFRDNSTNSAGGGAVSVLGTSEQKSILVIESCAFDNNRAATNSGSGGALNSGLASVFISNSDFLNNSADFVGGALYVDAESRMSITGGRFELNSAVEDGGAIFAQSGSDVTVQDVEFRGNSGDNGGAINIVESGLNTRDSRFFDNGVILRGGAINATRPSEFDIRNNQFSGSFSLIQEAAHINVDLNIPENGEFGGAIIGNSFVNVPNSVNDEIIRATGGRLKVSNNTAPMPQDRTFFNYSFFNNTLIGGPSQLQGNLVGGVPENKAGEKAISGCLATNVINGFPFESRGYNIFSDDSCMLDGPGDLANSDPMLEDPDGDGIVALKATSPAIDRGLDMLDEDGLLPCGYKDIRGLGRPQDGNADGGFECDSGAWELQGGPDLGAAQSSAYFDPSRSGEGVFVELIGGGLAFVAMFTYSMDGQSLVWFVGIGQVVGNSVVVDEFLQTSGGEFGSGFIAADIVRTPVAGLSLVFPNCQAASNPGRLTLQAAPETGFEDLLVTASRLTTIVPCTGTPPATSGRSGSFFDPNRDGEGIFVQWLSDGRVLVIWYTYDSLGNQFWTISGDVTVQGNTVTASMLYPATGTRFGSGFDPDAIDLQSWGTVTLIYSGCNAIGFSYDSVVPGFGAGSLDYVRLTTLAGTSCDL